MAAHEAGVLHSPGYGGTSVVPAWLRPPDDVNALLPALWATTVHRNDSGELEIGGVGARAVAEQYGTPAFVLDEMDFRARANAFRDAFAAAFGVSGADVYYAGKAFLCTGVASWIAQDGLSIDTCSGGELAVALRAGVRPERIALHGNNKLDHELDRAVSAGSAGIGRIVIDSLPEIERVAAAGRRHGRRVPVMLRINVGVEAHTHEFMATAHEDQKFGLSLSEGVAAQAAAAVLEHPELELLGLHAHIGSQIFDTAAFGISARRLLGLHDQIQREHGVALSDLDLGGGYGVAYTSQHDPLEPKALAEQLAQIVHRECDALRIAVPRVSVEPGRAIAGPSTFTLYRVGTIKDVPLDGGVMRRYVSVDGGMSDNIRTALYDADYSCTLASRSSQAAPVLSRVVGKHCESGDIVVRDEFLPGDLSPGDLIAVPGTGAYCRSMASQYNHVPRPPVLSVRDGQVGVLLRREPEDALRALDPGFG